MLLLDRGPHRHDGARGQVQIRAQVGAGAPQVVEILKSGAIRSTVGPVVEPAIGLVSGEEQARLEPPGEVVPQVEPRSAEHTSELQSQSKIPCPLLLEQNKIVRVTRMIPDRP